MTFFWSYKVQTNEIKSLNSATYWVPFNVSDAVCFGSFYAIFGSHDQ